MASGPFLLVLLVAAIAFIVYMTGKVRMNAFLVLLLAALFVGLLARTPPPIPSVDAQGNAVPGLLDVIASGFGSTLTSIGIVIVAGTIIGTILEKTGGALVLARTMLSLVGRNRAPLAMSLAGYIVSIPVFCDSGFVILSPLNKALAQSSGISLGVMGTALSMGLYATHTMVPPTPGPIAAAGNLGADLGMVILMGLIVSLPATLAGWIYAMRAGSRFDIRPANVVTYEELMSRFGRLPSTFGSFLPLVAPILLIALRSVAMFETAPFGTGPLRNVLVFAGHPIFALLLGVFFAMRLAPEVNAEVYGDWVAEGITQSAVILVITAAGGSLGAVLKATGIADYLGATLAQYRLGIFLPFIVAAAIKTAQGSSTVALITTSAIVAPLLAGLGLDSTAGRALATVAIGAGSMVVSHANDSYFWVVSQFSEMGVSIAYRLQTIGTLITGIVSIALISALAAILL
ncbi:MAG: GntP family permease [Bacillota bacterium]|jgi:GntP family gluconate:H+ symporter|nr:GntP family permease [Bacillota bacterium]